MPMIWTVRTIPFALFSAVAILYYRTMAPTVGFIDSGELATAAWSLGIAHPTGYPLFILFAHLASLIPFSPHIIVRLNILAVVLTAAAVTVFYFAILEFLRRGEEEPDHRDRISAALAAALLATSRTVWSQGLAVEVYSLHLVMLAIDLLVFLRAVRTGAARDWFLFAFVTGLAFTNHMTTILLAPAMIYWFIAIHGRGKETVRRIAILAVPFLAGLSLYLFLPIRAGQAPLMNWGDPVTAQKVWWHFTGRQFRVFMFTSAETAQRQFSYFLSGLTEEFALFALVLAAAGLAAVWTYRRKFIFAALLLVSCLAYSVNYDIHDIDSYFLLAYVAIALFLAWGIRWLVIHFQEGKGKLIVPAALAVLTAYQIWDHRSAVDLSEQYVVEDYTLSILNGLPPNAVVLTYQWDYFVAAAYYYQNVRGVRPDVTVIDKELLRRTWYFSQLTAHAPAVMEASAEEVRLFLVELEKFEQGIPYDPAMIEGRYTNLLRSFLERRDGRPVFTGPEIEPQYLPPVPRIPFGMLMQVTNDPAYHPDGLDTLSIRPVRGMDSYSRNLSMLIKNALVRRSEYELQQGFPVKASKIREKSLSF